MAFSPFPLTASASAPPREGQRHLQEQDGRQEEAFELEQEDSEEQQQGAEERDPEPDGGILELQQKAAEIHPVAGGNDQTLQRTLGLGDGASEGARGRGQDLHGACPVDVADGIGSLHQLHGGELAQGRPAVFGAQQELLQAFHPQSGGVREPQVEIEVVVALGNAGHHRTPEEGLDLCVEPRGRDAVDGEGRGIGLDLDLADGVRVVVEEVGEGRDPAQPGGDLLREVPERGQVFAVDRHREGLREPR